MTSEPLQLVWFKRDLRIADHAPLAQAAERGPVLPLYVIEPELWQQPDASARQWQFCREALIALRQALAALGQPLVVRVGSIESVLERAHRHWRVGALWSHQETGNGWTYARDRRVAAWARHAGIPWHESPQFGVIRPLPDRNGWARRWDERMCEAMLQAPPRLQPLVGVDPGAIPERVSTLMPQPPCLHPQRGGINEAQAVLTTFLQQRSRRYHSGLSSPLTADQSCSRLSPHLSWGTVSMREVVQRTRSRRQQLQGSTAGGRWPLALKRFEERLHWHCHFIQKLEDQPSLEFSELHPLTAGLREPCEARLEAWCTGQTGLPFVDACMRSLIATGWLNFRMRAMLMSVASYQLWLPWRQSGLHLARLFVDYEPGIHWSQVQMQSGTTGINTIRIYNPIKQALDHDPEGVFVRRWLPELAAVPAVYLHQPWTMDAATQQASGCIVGRDYPLPIVDWQQAASQARDRLWALRREQGFAETADAIQRRHGSRRSGLRPAAQNRRSERSNRPSNAVGSGTDQQLSLDLG